MSQWIYFERKDIFFILPFCRLFSLYQHTKTLYTCCTLKFLSFFFLVLLFDVEMRRMTNFWCHSEFIFERKYIFFMISPDVCLKQMDHEDSNVWFSGFKIVGFLVANNAFSTTQSLARLHFRLQKTFEFGHWRRANGKNNSIQIPGVHIEAINEE